MLSYNFGNFSLVQPVSQVRWYGSTKAWGTMPLRCLENAEMSQIGNTILQGYIWVLLWFLWFETLSIYRTELWMKLSNGGNHWRLERKFLCRFVLRMCWFLQRGGFLLSRQSCWDTFVQIQLGKVFVCLCCFQLSVTILLFIFWRICMSFIVSVQVKQYFREGWFYCFVFSV